MIALPVLAVTAADVRHADLDRVRRRVDRPADGRRRGAGRRTRGAGASLQQPDPDDCARADDGGDGCRCPTADAGRRRARRGPAARAAERRDAGPAPTRAPCPPSATEVDLADPVDRRAVRPGLRAAAARTPARSWSTRCSPTRGSRSARRSTARGRGRRDPIIVGIAESTTTRDYPIAAGPLGRLRPRGRRTVEQLARGRRTGVVGRRSASSTTLGVTVASRAVHHRPAARSRRWPEEVAGLRAAPTRRPWPSSC